MKTYKITINDILNLIQTQTLNVNQLEKKLHTSKKDIKLILSKSGYPLPTAKCNVKSDAYIAKIQDVTQSKIDEAEGLSGTIEQLRSGLEQAQTQFKQQLITDMIEKNRIEGEALKRLKKDF